MGFFQRTHFRPPVRSERLTQTRVSIALGGGGARGAAHLGVMRAISQTGLDVRRVVGVSMGALIGAMCAVEPNIRKVEQQAIEMLRSPWFVAQQGLLNGAAHQRGGAAGTGLFAWYKRLRHYVATHRKFSRAVTEPALLGGAVVREAIDSLLPDIDIRETAMPLSIVAADLLSGHKIVLESGSLRTAVQGSMAIPGIFPPVEHRGMLLCDIGAIDSLPINIAKSYPHDVAIGVDVSQAPAVIRDCSTALDVMVRMDEIGERMMRGKVLPEADLIIRPHVDRIEWFDFHHVERLIEAGYRAGHDSLRSLRRGSAVEARCGDRAVCESRVLE